MAILGPNGLPYNSAGVEEDPVKREAKEKWSDRAYLQELHYNFLAAVQQESKKDYRYKDDLDYVINGSPKWDEHSSFEEWCKDTEERIADALVELKIKIEQNRPTDAHLRDLADEGVIDSVEKNYIRNLDKEDAEFYEAMLRKSLEAVKAYMRGDYSLEEIIRYARNKI